DRHLTLHNIWKSLCKGLLKSISSYSNLKKMYLYDVEPL
uniref:Uncharacterized protein n=1 Tax=Oryzias latipes TaxID=8090 RepID=A0A3B3HPK5_ORYLA